MRYVMMLVAWYCSLAGGGASAQSVPVPRATQTAPPASATLMYCPLSVRVREIDDTRTRYAVSFRALETGRASGTVALWAGDRRYDVSFRDAVALDSRDRISPETSFVVRFAAPTPLDGAVVTAIDEGGTLHPCDPWYAPWVPAARSGPDRRTREQRTAEDRLLSHARAAAATDAPPAIADPTTCAEPSRPARTVRAVAPNRPSPILEGVSVISVLLDPTDKIVAARIETSSGNRSLDLVAFSAARGSEFEGQIFRCRHVMGSYLFSVDFSP